MSLRTQSMAWSLVGLASLLAGSSAQAQYATPPAPARSAYVYGTVPTQAYGGVRPSSAPATTYRAPTATYAAPAYRPTSYPTATYPRYAYPTQPATATYRPSTGYQVAPAPGRR
jgi:hypothetical protein